MFPMSRITISAIARRGTLIFSVAVALCLSAVCHAQDMQQIDKNGIVVFDSFPSYPSGGDWTAANALDKTSGGTHNQYVTDYASAGGGINTFLSFDFGQQYNFAAILFTDRTTSGSSNGKFFGG